VPILPLTLLFAVVSAQTAAPHASESSAWPPTHEISTPLERFPPAERTVVLSLLKPYLGPLVQGESPEELNHLMRSFHAERLTLAGSPAQAVQPSGGEFCGATGNCSFWIVDLRHRRVVLNTVGIQSFAAIPSRPGGMPEIITSSHASAFERELIRWQFQGSSYQRASCATVDTANDDGQPYPKPMITPHPCSIEGN
jgi:hypothetical protein